jgi:hypothetical protein
MDLQGAIFIVVVAILVVTSISLGMFLSRIGSSPTQKTGTQDEVSAGNDTHLDRIEKSIRESTCVGIIAISAAAIVAAGTIDIGLGWKLLLYFIGGFGIVYSVTRYFRRH